MRTSSKAAVTEFEREMLSAFRGELKRVNGHVDLLPEERNSGMACRIAAYAVMRELRPQSKRGLDILLRHLLARPTGLLYMTGQHGGEEVKDAKAE